MAETTSEKKKALDAALTGIRKQFGEGSIMKLGESAKTNIDVIPTGSMSLDLALGIGGLPRGRIVEIYGPESSGKTTLTLHVVAEAQKLGGEVAFIDAEHALDPEYANRPSRRQSPRAAQAQLPSRPQQRQLRRCAPAPP